MRILLERVVTMRPGEGATAWLMFTYSFLAMTCYNIVKPVTRSKFIADLGADNLPYALLAAGFLIGLLMELHSRAMRRLPRRAIIPVTQGALLTVLLAFYVLFSRGTSWASAGFYLFGMIFGILLISQFWTLANAIYESRQARRLFGFIGGGASLGGMMGSSLTVFVVSRVGTTNLLLVSAAILVACTAITIIVIRKQRLSDVFTVANTEEGVSGQEALNLLRRSRHLRVIALVIACAAISGTLIEQQLNMAAEALGGEDAITEFLAAITFYVSLFGFIMQVAFTSRIHRSLGLVFALTILPISLGSTGLIILATGALWAVASARIIDTALRYSLDKTTREVLFLPLPGDVRDRAKPFVDVTVDRFGKAIAAVMILVLIQPWGLGLEWRGLSFVSLLVMVLWIVVAMVARSEYVRSFRRSLDTRALEPEAMRVDVADSRTIETLVEELSSPDESAVLYAIGTLESLDKRHLVTPLLLYHESPSVRARALTAIAGARHAGRSIPAVQRLLKDPDADVRASAVAALAALQKEDVSALMLPYLDDPDPRLAVTAAAALADSNDVATARIAEAAFAKWIGDTRQIARDGRREAAAALARVRNPDFRSLLVPLIHDPDIDVARQAIASARVMGQGHTLFVPALVGLLGHRVLKRDAREALGAYDDLIGILAYVLHDRDEHPWVRRHIPATLASIGGQASVDALFAALPEADGFLRYKVIEALEKLRRRDGALAFDPEAVTAQIVKDTGRYFMYLSLRYNVVQHDGAALESLLVRTLDDKLARTLDRIYRLLGLVYPWRDIAAARAAIERGDLRRRAGAVEYLDQVLSGIVRKRVMPIVDVEPLGEKVRYANNLIKSRPRDIDDTLAQLVHDDDAVVAAVAVSFVRRKQLWNLAGDLAYIGERRTADPLVIEAAAWALATRGEPEAATALWPWMPVVEVADRLRAMPLFSVVFVDELFRIAASARQVRHEPGRSLGEVGAEASEVQFLVEGAVQLETGEGAGSTVTAPAALGFEEVLEGRPLSHAAVSLTPVECLVVKADDFLTMLSDNIVLAQGVFRLLLASRSRGVWVSTPAADHSAGGRTLEPASTSPHVLSPLEKALLLRPTPLLAQATVEQLLALASVAREIRFERGQVLAADTDPPAVYHVIAGSLRIERDGRRLAVVGAGGTVGAPETLAGDAPQWQVVADSDGHALQLEREELFEVLAEHLDLLQGLYSGALRAARAEEAASEEPSPSPVAAGRSM